MLRKLAAVAVIAPLLFACAPGSNPVVTTVADAKASIVNALTNNLAPGVNQTLGNIAAKVTSSRDVQVFAEALPWAAEALKEFGPDIHASATTIGAVSTAITDAAAILKNPPADAAAALSHAAAAYHDAMALLGPLLGK